MENANYRKRFIDEKIDLYITVLGAISLEGPKWCGKTWTALNHGENVYYLEDKATRERADLDVNLVLKGERPVVIDEWNKVPKIWDAVRRECDKTTETGNYILTCSTKLTTVDERKKIFHSGAGRIGKVKMYSMSLYESGDSTGKASIMDMYNNTLVSGRNDAISLEKLANLIVRGGWPQNINNTSSAAGLLPKFYIENILDKDMNDDKKETG